MPDGTKSIADALSGAFLAVELAKRSLFDRQRRRSDFSHTYAHVI
jgi:hypothetical protein